MQKNKIRLAFVLDSLTVGGGEKHTLQLFNRLSSKQFERGLVYLKRREHLLSEVDRSRGPVWCADFGRGWDRRGLRSLAVWLKTFEPTVVVAVNTYPLFYAHMARNVMPYKPLIAEIFHTLSCDLKEALKMHLVYRWCFLLSDQIIYISETQKRYWMSRGFVGKKNTRIYNGIDIRHFEDKFSDEEKRERRERLGFDADELVVGICAIMRPEKNHLSLLEAQKIARRRGIFFKVLMIGDGPMRAVIENRIRAYKLENEVRITGIVSDVRPDLAICDCLVISSDRIENFSLAVLEAMAMGKAVIASDVGAACEQIEDGREGLIYPADCVEGLIHCLSRIREKNFRENLGRNAYKKVRALFDQKRMICEYEELFLNMAELKRARPA